MKRFIFILCCAFPAFAGQSIILGSSSGAMAAGNASIPAQNQPFSLEFNLDVFPTSLGAFNGNYIFGDPFTPQLALPVDIQVNNTGSPSVTTLSINFPQESGSTGFPVFPIGGISGNAVWVKLVHDTAASGGTNTDTVTLWDQHGNVVQSASQTYTSNATSTNVGYQIVGGQSADEFHFAWVRGCTGHAVISGLGKVPTTFGGCAYGTELWEWKFDGTLTDSSGNGYDATLSGAGGTTAVYATSCCRTVVPILKTLNAPSWGPVASLRAGNAAQLDATASYSQADTTNTCIPFWQILTSPAAPHWVDAQSSSQPHVILPAFGDYLTQLQCTDSAGNLAVATADIGAIATDLNGVVIQAQSSADDIFGPMIAWGSNPWGYQDYLSKIMVDEQYTYQGCCTPPSWTVPGAGTASYTFCTLASCGATGTTTTGSLTATALSVPIANASILDLSALPTTAYVDSELMLVTATTATSGAATLTIGYDGRGLQGGGITATAATTHSNGATVGQFRITGSSSKFVTDANSPICPAASGTGLPAPSGRIIYSTGTVTMTPGSAAITGVGTTWTNGNGVATGQIILVYATHGGGTRFNFFPTLTLNGTTSITASRVYPSDADSGAFTYAIVNYRYPSIEYTRADGSIGRTIQGAIQVCLGDLQMGGFSGHDYGATINSTTFSGVHYSYEDGLGQISAFGPNFYGTGLAARAHYLRSGYGKALQLANFIDDYWCLGPEVDGGYAGGFILNEGWAGIGCIADYATQPSSALRSTSDKGTTNGTFFARGFAGLGSQVVSAGCNDDDTRDTGLKRGLNGLAAKFDTGSYQTSWITQLEAIYNSHDVGGNACKQTDNSFANSFITGPSVATLGLTNGSTNVTGTGFTSGLCSIAASGTINVTNGSGAATSASGTGFSGANPGTSQRIIIQGPSGYVTAFSFIWNSNSSITLNGQWPTTSGTYSYSIDSNVPTTIGATINDNANLALLHACTYVSSTQLTLDRAWGGTSGSYNMYNTAISSSGSYPAIGGYLQQPFMAGGPGVYSLNFAAKADTGIYPALWQTLANNAAAWVWAAPSYDQYSNALQYGVLCGGCDQKIPVSTTVGWVYGGSPGTYSQADASTAGIGAARTLAVEGMNSMSVAYTAAPSAPLKLQLDKVYGSAWGATGYTTGGVYAGDNNPALNCSPSNLASFKWPGFCFGAAMSHQWPAVRQGGVRPAVPRTIGIGVCFSSCPGRPTNATSVTVSITLPSGNISTNTCTSGSTCTVIGDSRQGTSYIGSVKYFNSGALIEQGSLLVVAQ